MTTSKMRITVFFVLTLVVVGIFLIFMPHRSDAAPYQRPGALKCPPTCSIYCPCGNLLDRHGCPICRCRPSNVCTGRRPNAHPRQPQGYSKSRILY